LTRLVDRGAEGKIYDNPDPKVVYPHILAFCKTYQIDTSILAEPDLHKYPTLNAFFSRKLRPDVRPITAPEDLSVVTSAADCRLTVFESAAEATNVWYGYRIPSISVY
jgi:phosphatidylserine decarboxylase